MRLRTSVTLSSELLEKIDLIDGGRSAFLERAALAYLAALSKEASNAKDAELIDRNCDRLNEEASDVLGYQSPFE